MATSVRFQIRGDTAENWESRNPVLLNRELGYDKTNNRLKVGDGLRAWNDLPYVAPDVINDLITGGVDKALSAEQGKVLKGLLDTKADSSDITAINNEFNEFKNNFTSEINEIIENKLDANKVTHETWVFTLEDESTVDKEVMLWSS